METRWKSATASESSLGCIWRCKWRCRCWADADAELMLIPMLMPMLAMIMMLPMTRMIRIQPPKLLLLLRSFCSFLSVLFPLRKKFSKQQKQTQHRNTKVEHFFGGFGFDCEVKCCQETPIKHHGITATQRNNTNTISNSNKICSSNNNKNNNKTLFLM